MKIDDIMQPSFAGEAYHIMQPRIKKVRTLLGNTEAMRNAGEDFLPMHVGEEEANYRERLETNVLFNMTEIVLGSWVSKPFSEPVQLSDDMDEKVVGWMDDINQCGDNHEVFLRSWFYDGMAAGLSHVWVEFPKSEAEYDEDGNPLPRLKSQDIGRRPTMKIVNNDNLLYAEAEVVKGKEILTEVRILDEVYEKKGYGQVCYPRILQVFVGRVVIWELTEESKKKNSNKEEWQVVDEYSYGLDYIPFVTFYVEREGFMIGKTPITPVADLNITHWQSSSDQRAILTVSRFPILACSGADGTDLTIGPHSWLHTKNPNGKFYYVEHAGSSIGAGEKDLQQLEEKAMHYATSYMKKRPSIETATARLIDNVEATSPLQDAVLRFQDAANLALQYMADWMSIENSGTFTINRKFEMNQFGEPELRILTEMRKLRDISRTKMIGELKKKNVLSEDFDEEGNDDELEEELNDAMEAAAKQVGEIDPQSEDETGEGGDGDGE